MANEECKGDWIRSVRISGITGDTVLDPGLFRISEDSAGNLVGQHIATATTPLASVRCIPEGQHKRISFTRTVGNTLIIYRGKVVFNGVNHVIVQGKYDLINVIGATLDDLTLTAGDSGDWSSEKPGV